MPSPFWIRFWTLILLLPITAVGSVWAATATPAPSLSPVTGPTFSQLLNSDSLSGLTFATEDVRKTIQNQYLEWLQFKNKKMPMERKLAWMELCRTQPISVSSPFCPFILRDGKNLAGQKLPPNLNSARRVLSRAEVLRLWKSDQWGGLSNLGEKELSYIVKSLRNGPASRSIAEKIVQRSECLPSELLVGVGLKLESAFPQPEYRKLVEKLYEKGAVCGQDTWAVISSYRLGLLDIWDGHCNEAEKVFARVPDTPNSADYRMRIGYWRYYCADQQKDESLKTTLRDWVTREYPLSLHSLLVHSSKIGSDLQWKDAADPVVLLRPPSNLDLSTTTGAVEYLLSIGEKHPAVSLLAGYQAKVLAEKPEFRLYWAMLMRRAGNNSECFRFMASAFRENPKLISRSTLQILYPKNFLELVPSTDPLFDPFFALSIIRQESAFDPDARSVAGAYGLMQLQVPTARTFQRRVMKKQLFDPKLNIQIGIKYINQLFRSQNGAVELALASYNAGPGRIKEWRRRYPVGHRLLFVDLLPARETRDYVSSILRNYFWYLKLYADADEPVGRKLAAKAVPLIEAMLPVK